jgi:hypothetical protein
MQAGKHSKYLKTIKLILARYVLYTGVQYHFPWFWSASMKLKFLSALVLGLALAITPVAKADSIVLDSHVGNAYKYSLNLDSNINIFLPGGFTLTGITGLTNAYLSSSLDNIFDISYNSTSVLVATLAGVSFNRNAPYSIGYLTLISDAGPGPIDFTILDSNGISVGTVTGPDVAATPEPSSLALLGTGVLAAAGALRRRFAIA